MNSARRIWRSQTLLRLDKTKTIGFFGGLCLLVNATTGPSIPYTANIFQTSGWLSIIFLFLFFMVLSTLCTLFLVQAMQSIPGNKYFQGVVEYGTLINFYFGPWAHVAGQICLYAAVQSTCIVLTSQTFDALLLKWVGQTCGYALSDGARWTCVESTGILTQPSPFSSIMLFTIGYLIAIGFSIPLGFIDLDDNIILQVVSFLISMFFILQWAIASILSITTGKAPVPADRLPVATGQGIPTAVGTIMLSMAFTYVVPSWINVKKQQVSAQGTLWLSSFSTMLIYIIVGVVPSLAFDVADDGNIIPSLSRFGVPQELTIYTCIFFTIVMLLPAIPVASIVSYKNLVQNDIFRKPIAIFASYLAPWLVAIPFLNGQYSAKFLTWSSLLFVSTANFLIPLLIYFKCRAFRQEYNQNRKLTKKQLKLLRLIHDTSNTIQNYIERGDYAIPLNPLGRSRENSISQTQLSRNQPMMEVDALEQQETDRSSTNPESMRRVSSTANLLQLPANSSPRILFGEIDMERASTRSKRNNVTLRRGTRNAHTIRYKRDHDDSEPVVLQRHNSMPTEMASNSNIGNETTPPPSINQPEFEHLSPILLHNVPDPEIEDEINGRSKIEDKISRVFTILSVSRKSTKSNGVSSTEDATAITTETLHREQTIPRNPGFISPAFRVIPEWVPFKEVTVAWVCFLTLSILVAANIIFELVHSSK